MRKEDPDVPRVGRGKLRPRLPAGDLLRIAMLLLALVFVLMMREGCAHGVASWFNVFAPPPAADAG